MKNRHILGVFFVLLLFVLTHHPYSQDNWWKDKKYKTESARVKYSKCKKVFVDIGNGFVYSNVYSINQYFNGEVYLNITGQDKGYYSNDQAKFILESFINDYPVDSFKWRNSSRSDIYAFATGKYRYKKNGSVNTLEISISLNYIDDSWLIDQIIIN